MIFGADATAKIPDWQAQLLGFLEAATLQLSKEILSPTAPTSKDAHDLSSVLLESKRTAKEAGG